MGTIGRIEIECGIIKKQDGDRGVRQFKGGKERKGTYARKTMRSEVSDVAVQEKIYIFIRSHPENVSRVHRARQCLSLRTKKEGKKREGLRVVSGAMPIHDTIGYHHETIAQRVSTSYHL